MPSNEGGDAPSNATSGEGNKEGGEKSLEAGAARADITPDAGRSFQGYVRPDIRSKGVESRLFGRALVLDDSDRKVALVSADLLFGIDKEELVERVRPLGFTHENLLYVGTHTHAGTEAGEWTTAQIANAIADADAAKKSAVAGWGTATVSGVSQNRSLEAHLANHGLDLSPGTASPEDDPEGPVHPRDEELRLLRVETPEGEPIALWTEFAVHPTAFPPSNTLYSSDLVGASSHHFSELLDDGEPVKLFGNHTSGDLIPVYDDYNKHAVADGHGRRLAEGMVGAWEDAEDSLSGDFPVSGHGKTVEYDGQEAEPGKRVASRGVFGIPFLAGAKNGPSPLHGLGLQGRRRPKSLAGDVHGRKIPVAPVPWDSKAEVQVVRLGNRVLLGAPGEPTVQTGRKWKEEVADAVPDGVSDIGVIGLANDYNGYFTTPEEYDQQHYEGGHTVFGKHTESLLRKTYVELCSEVGDSSGSSVDGHGERDEKPEVQEGDSDVNPPVGAESAGRLLTQPGDTVERMSVVTVEWSGGRKGRERPVGGSFARLERSTDNGWETVATDLDLGLVWEVGGGTYTARYEVPPTAETGTYRFRVTATGYELETEVFDIVPSTDLRILGAELEDDEDASTLVFRAQNPPPNADLHLRSRRVHPRRGELKFGFEGKRYTADWDEDAEAWTAEVENVARGDEVTVPEGSLVDGAGNRSGGEKTIEVGELDEVSWPSNMETGGGRPPGPFGLGRFPF